MSKYDGQNKECLMVAEKLTESAQIMSVGRCEEQKLKRL